MEMLKALLGWVDARFPATKLWEEHLSKYYAPKNFNFWYFFGSLALLVLVIQVVTGIFLTMNYKPDANLAFASVEYIMRDVNWGWLIRYMHSTGASFFFIVVYLHMFRAMLYGSYKKPRELIWIIGMLIFFVLMAEGFAGYLLPWGQMSYWGAQVIISLFGAIPIVGDGLVEFIAPVTPDTETRCSPAASDRSQPVPTRRPARRLRPALPHGAENGEGPGRGRSREELSAWENP